MPIKLVSTPVRGAGPPEGTGGPWCPIQEQGPRPGNPPRPGEARGRVKTFFSLVLGLLACLGGCNSMGREIVTGEDGRAGAAAPPEAPRPRERVARFLERADRCAGRVRDEARRLVDEGQCYIQAAADSDVTQCVLVPLYVAGFVLAFCGHGAFNVGSFPAPAP